MGQGMRGREFGLFIYWGSPSLSPAQLPSMLLTVLLMVGLPRRARSTRHDTVDTASQQAREPQEGHGPPPAPRQPGKDDLVRQVGD